MTVPSHISIFDRNTGGVTRPDLHVAIADEARLRGALAEADIVPQLLLEAQLSGQDDLLDEARPFIRGGWSYQVDIPEDLRGRISERLIVTLKAAAASGTALTPPSPERFMELLNTGIGTTIGSEYSGMMLEEMNDTGADHRSVAWRDPAAKTAAAACKVVIAGAGLAGLCMGAKLREAGIPFVIIEKNDAVGGTWYENTYPGSGVDIPTHFYSFSFDPKPDWSHHFAKHDELWAYLDRFADKFDVRRDIRFNTEVVGAKFDDASASWQVTIRGADGATETLDASFFVPAVGQLNRPSIPKIPGLEGFDGPMFHTAEWDHSVDITGKRVALVGTGASSMQAGPAIAGEVERLLVFQRSPNWASHNPNYHLSVTDGMKWALAHIPFYAKWNRFLLFWASGDLLHSSLQIDPAWPTPKLSLNPKNDAMRQALTAHIKSEIGDDPELLAKVIPNYPPYGKRMLRDNNWYKMLKRDNVDLIDASVTKVDGKRLTDGHGESHEVDVLVLATGFQASRMLWPMEIEGRDGKTIRSEWGEDDPRAYLGITVPSFPNMFVIFGPNTSLAHGGSLFFHTECQVRYAMQAIRETIEKGHATIECRPEPFAAYNDRIDDAHNKMVWTHKGTTNWYRNSAGRVVTNSPWRLVDYWQLTHTFDPADFTFT